MPPNISRIQDLLRPIMQEQDKKQVTEEEEQTESEEKDDDQEKDHA